MVFHQLVQKHYHFQAFCTDRTQIYVPCPVKNLKLVIFIANSSSREGIRARAQGFAPVSIGSELF